MVDAKAGFFTYELISVDMQESTTMKTQEPCLPEAPDILKDLYQKLRRAADQKEDTLAVVEALVTNTDMSAVWKSIDAKNGGPIAPETATRFVAFLQRLRSGPPTWLKLSPAQRTERLQQMAYHVNELIRIQKVTPIEKLTDYSYQDMGTEIPESARLILEGEGGHNFSDMFHELQGWLESVKHTKYFMERPNHEDALRLFFVVNLDWYFARNISKDMTDEIATIARLILRDPQIDRETVRKILSRFRPFHAEMQVSRIECPPSRDILVLAYPPPDDCRPSTPRPTT